MLRTLVPFRHISLPPDLPQNSQDPATNTRKPRLTTDKSGPHDATDATGRPIADNANIDLDDHAEAKLPRVSDIRQAVEVLGSMARSVMPAVREAASTARKGVFGGATTMAALPPLAEYEEALRQRRGGAQWPGV